MDLERSLDYCTYCPKLCRPACPVSNAEPRETFIPQAKMTTLRRIHQRARSAEEAAALYACMGCGACTEACRHSITPGHHLLDGRAEAEHAKHGHPALADLPDRVRAHGERAAKRVAELVPAERRRWEAEVALMPGCDDPDAVAAAVRLADRLGADYLAVAPVRPLCGGYPLLAGGFPEAFRLHAEAMAKQLQGFARVVVACPACAWTMKHAYPAHGVPLRPIVLHTTEFFAQFIERMVAVEKRGEVFYHDPCYLGRYLGIYDEPRRLLGRVAVVREFSRCRAESECSGGGGLLPITMPEVSQAIAAARLVEVEATAVQVVATACPTCKRQLGRGKVVARDVLEVIEACLQSP